MENDDHAFSEDWLRYEAIEQQPRFHDLDWLAIDDPGRAWPLLLELLAVVPEDLVYNVGCGPLETFIRRHGAAFVDQLESEARDNERFRVAVIEVNLPQGHLPADVEARLVAAFGRRFELLPPVDPDDE